MIYGAALVVIVVALLAVSLARLLKLRTHADFMVADRRLSWRVLVFTLLCSWIGAGSLFGGAEFAVEQGIAALWLAGGGWVGLLVVYFTAPRARAFAQYTVPDLLETRYSPLARVFGTLAIVISSTAIVSYQFRGGGRILNLAFGVPENWGTCLVAAFVIALTALAGMSSVAYTDLVIGLVVTVGCLAALPNLLSAAGGLSGVRDALPPSHFTALGTMSVAKALGYFFPTFTLVIGNQTMYQKFFSAATARDARAAVVGWLAGTVVLETAIVLLAMLGGVVFRREIASGSLPGWAIIPHAARHGVAPVVGAVLLAAVFAKVVSTGNSWLFSPSTSVVHDVFQRFLLKGWNDASRGPGSDRRLLALSRVVVVVTGLVALAQSFQPSILSTAVYAYDVYGAGITPAVLAAFFWKRATTAGGLSSICAGTAVAVAWKVFALEARAPMIYPSLAVAILSLVGVSLLTSRPAERQWKPFFGEQGIGNGE